MFVLKDVKASWFAQQCTCRPLRPLNVNKYAKYDIISERY